MTKRSIMMQVLLTLLLTVISIGGGTGIANAEHKFYFGLGGSYAFRDMNDNIVDQFDDVDISLELGDSYGVNGRFGWRPTDLFALELNFDHMPSFDRTEGIEVIDIPVDVKGELAVTTIMLDAKLFPLRFGAFDFRLFGGLGVMWADLKTEASTSYFEPSVDISVDDTLPCGEIGLGLGVMLGNRFALGAEAGYVASFGDIADQDYGIGYALVTVGFDIYF